jgi:hypothetical protein
LTFSLVLLNVFSVLGSNCFYNIKPTSRKGFRFDCLPYGFQDHTTRGFGVVCGLHFRFSPKKRHEATYRGAVDVSVEGIIFSAFGRLRVRVVYDGVVGGF